MLPPVSLCLVPAILTNTLFLFSTKWREEVTPLRSVTTQQIAKHHDQRHVTPARRARARPHLRMRARSGARAHAHPHTNVHCAPARAQTRTITHTHLRGRAGPASRARCLSTTKCEARQSRCEIDTEPMVGRRRTVRRCRPHGKPSMPKHIVGP